MGNVRDIRIGKVTRRQRVVTEFICTVCRSRYHTLRLAQECAAMPVEPRQFAKGDRVTWREVVRCERQERMFQMRAKVIEVLELEPPDREVTNKYLGGKLPEMHMRQYEVAFRCSCGQSRKALLYAAEMKRI